MSNQKELTRQADEIIRKHIMFSLGAGLVPIPVMDIIGVSVIQLDMLRQLSRLYGVPFKEELGKSYISAIGGTTIARIGASFIKTIPGIGSVIGGFSMSALSGGMTYALGEVFKTHFAEGGNLADVDVKEAKKVYKEEFEKGKKVAKEMEKEKKQSNDDDDSDVFDKIEKLAALKTKGLITEKDFNKQKERLLNSI